MAVGTHHHADHLAGAGAGRQGGLHGGKVVGAVGHGRHQDVRVPLQLPGPHHAVR